MLSCQSAADVHDGRCLVERSAIILPTVTTRDEDRAQYRQANLSAMHVPCEHQVHVMRACPGDIVRCVAEAKTKNSLRTFRQVRRRREPWAFVADHNHRHATHIDL